MVTKRLQLPPDDDSWRGRNSSFKIEIHGQTTIIAPKIICLSSGILWVQRNTFASVNYLFYICDSFALTLPIIIVLIVNNRA